MYFQRPFNDVGQAGEVVLEHVVGHALANGFHGSGFANGTGKQDERGRVGVTGQQCPGIQRGKAGQMVVRQHHIAVHVVQRILKSLQGIDGQDVCVPACTAQRQPGQLLICGRVLQMKDAQSCICCTILHG